MSKLGLGECRLGYHGPAADRAQHNFGRPYLTSEDAANHAAWCRDFSGRAPEADQPRDAVELQLRGQSDLFACGYQITEMDREERWRVLVAVAVPLLGLAAVMTQIDWLIQSRSNQRRDYRHAIGEWEHDLSRLRRWYGRS